jgi:hypothetical protein
MRRDIFPGGGKEGLLDGGSPVDAATESPADITSPGEESPEATTDPWYSKAVRLGLPL